MNKKRYLKIKNKLLNKKMKSNIQKKNKDKSNKITLLILIILQRCQKIS